MTSPSPLLLFLLVCLLSQTCVRCLSLSLFVCRGLRVTHTRHTLTVGNGLHAEAQQCVQEVHDVVQRVFVDVLAHRLPELHLVQLVQAGQAVLGLEGEAEKKNR